MGLISGLERSPRGRKWQLTPVFLPGKSHGQRSLMGCSPWGCEELDTTERLSLQISILLRYSPRFAIQFALHYDLLIFLASLANSKGSKEMNWQFPHVWTLGLFALTRLFHLTYCLHSPTQQLLACEFSSQKKPSLALPCLGEMPLL